MEMQTCINVGEKSVVTITELNSLEAPHIAVAILSSTTQFPD